MAFMKLLFSNDERNKDLGLLIMRVGIGLLFMNYGWGKLMAGSEQWIWLGSQMAHLGITWAPWWWGLKAAASEAIGGVLLVLGFCTRIGAFLIAAVMSVAVVMHLSIGDGFKVFSFPLSLLFVMLGLICAGGGRYSFDHMLEK